MLLLSTFMLRFLLNYPVINLLILTEYEKELILKKYREAES